MANSWNIFQNLITEEKKWIGKVVSINPTNKKIEVYPAGTTQSIIVDSNGTDYVVDSYVFVEGSTITGQAPDISTAVNTYVN